MNSILDGLDTSGKIKALMATRKVTQLELANVLGVTLPTIGNRFDANFWHVDDLKKIAETYNVEVTDLI